MTIVSRATEDPLLSFNFGVEIDGIFEGFFMDCSGLQSEREVVEYKEGGENSYIHKFPGQIKYSNIVLKRGITSSNKFWQWYQEGRRDGKVSRRSLSIVLFDAQGKVINRWNVENAYPVKWSGPDLKTDNNNVAIETLELIHHGLTLAQ